jgi:hypothetical protein
MPKTFFRVPENLIQEWPEVFEDLWISTMPVDYLHSLQIEFVNGRVWEINVSDKIGSSESALLSKKLKETFIEYKDTIKDVQIQLNINKLKSDVEKSTKNFL